MSLGNLIHYSDFKIRLISLCIVCCCLNDAPINLKIGECRESRNYVRCTNHVLCALFQHAMPKMVAKRKIFMTWASDDVLCILFADVLKLLVWKRDVSAAVSMTTVRRQYPTTFIHLKFLRVITVMLFVRLFVECGA